MPALVCSNRMMDWILSACLGVFCCFFFSHCIKATDNKLKIMYLLSALLDWDHGIHSILQDWSPIKSMKNPVFLGTNPISFIFSFLFLSLLWLNWVLLYYYLCIPCYPSVYKLSMKIPEPIFALTLVLIELNPFSCATVASSADFQGKCWTISLEKSIMIQCFWTVLSK